MTQPLDKVPATAPQGGGGPAPSNGHRGGTPPEAIKAIPVRHYGRWISALILLALLALVVKAFAGGDIMWDVVGDKLFDKTFIDGAGMTLLISVLAMVIGIVLGMLLAVMRLSKNPVLSAFAWGYIWFFRGTPVLVQLFLWFNLSIVFKTLNLMPLYKNDMNDVMTPFLAALLALGLNEAAYMAEIGRAGIQSVDKGQTEAAQALGMKSSNTMRRIVVPQAMRVIIPPTGNEYINMLKTSSLAFAIGYNELFLASRNFSSTTLATVESLIIVSIWYLALTTVFSIGQYYLERYYARGSDHGLPKTPWQKIKGNLSTGPRLMGGART